MDKLKEEVELIQGKVADMAAAVEVRSSTQSASRPRTTGGLIRRRWLLICTQCAAVAFLERAGDGIWHELFASQEPRAAQLHQDGALLHSAQGMGFLCLGASPLR